MNKLIVTTSWDDGHRLDMKLAELLKKYNLPATFYVSPRDHEFASADLLTEDQIRNLSHDFEIGSHTMTHPVLTDIEPAVVASELTQSKAYLSQLIGREVTSFCYPCGKYNAQVAKAAEAAGYQYARTVERFSLVAPTKRFEAPTTLETYRNPLPTFPRDLISIARLNNFNPIATLRCLNWEHLAKTTFDIALQNGGVYHLWGHSWVIERSKDWDKVERVFAYISQRTNVNYLTNAQLAEGIQK